MTPWIGSLCSGYGGLDAGVQLVLGGTVAWHSDIDPGASKILAHHWPTAPNHGDLTTTDWATVEPVDIITAGWPCQPWSLAGKGKGAQDERAIWPAVADAVRHLRPRHVILENVAAVVVLGELARAVGDLASIGYDAQWLCLRASDVGAPHGRNRCFIVATDTARIGHQRAGQSRDGWAGPADSGSVVTYTTGNGRDEGWPEPAGQLGRPDAAERGGAATPDADGATGPVTGGIAPGSPQGAASEAFRGTGRSGSAPDPAWGQYEPAIRRGGLDDPSSAGTGQDMRGLRSDVQPQAVWRREDSRRHGPIPDAPILFTELREHQDSGDKGRAPLASTKVQAGSLSGVQENRSTARTSPRPEPRQQRPDESDDALRDLPPETPLAGGQAVSGGSTTAPRTSAVRDVRGVVPSPALAHTDLLADVQSGFAQHEDNGVPTTDWGQYAPAIYRWAMVLGRVAPPPTEPGKTGNPRLSARFVEFLMGLPEGHVTDVPGLSRNEQLKALGNGVVPQQAAAALRMLLDVEEAVA